MGRIIRAGNTACDRITHSGSAEETRSPRARYRDLDPRAALLRNFDPVEVKVVVGASERKSVINVLVVSDADKGELPRDGAK